MGIGSEPGSEVVAKRMLTDTQCPLRVCTEGGKPGAVAESVRAQASHAEGQGVGIPAESKPIDTFCYPALRLVSRIVV